MARVSPGDVFQGLVSRGLPPHVAEGIVMNLGDESGFDTGINEVAPLVQGSRGGFGLAQWTGPRRTALESYASGRGASVDDLDTQLDFLVDELHGPERRALDKMMATRNAGDAAASVATDFLRPARQHLDRRVADYTGGSSTDWPMGNALAPAEPDYSAQVNALTGALDQQQDRRRDPQFWGGIDPSLFMSRRA